MRVPAVSVASKIVVAAFSALMMLAFIPVDAFAEGEGAPSAPLASSLMDGSASVVREDVALAASEDDATLEPVIGSFTVDGLTFAVMEGFDVELVGVAPSITLSGAAEGGVVEGSNESLASEAGATNLALPESVTYEGVSYTLASIGAYAFYLSGVTSVTLPASVSDVDECAFRSSDVASVMVAEGNQTYSSFDGALYDASQSSLLLIPEGKQGAVLLPKTAEVAEASVFSHCPLVDSISVEKDGAAFASENGLLYSSDLATLLRVPAGATEIAIREGCTTIAAGALEACVKLSTISAPATVTSISPDVFHAIPTVGLPAVSAILSEGSEAASPSVTLSGAAEGGEVEGPDEGQITAMVALSSAADDTFEIDMSAIDVELAPGADARSWLVAGFMIDGGSAEEAVDKVVRFNSAIIAKEVSLNEISVPAPSLQGARNNDDSFTVYADGGTISLYADAEFSNRPPINLDAWQNIDEITVYAANSGHSAPAIIAKNHSQNMWFQSPDTIRFGWWDRAFTGTPTDAIQYYIDITRPGYTPGGIYASGTLTPENDVNNQVPFRLGGTYRVSTWVKKDSHRVILDPNGGVGDYEAYYWPDKGYTTSRDSTDVVGVGSVIAANKPEREGYEFDGYWSQESGGTQYVDKDGKLTSRAGVLSQGDVWYAHWTPTNCRIKLVTYGGTVSGWSEVSATLSEGKRYERLYTIESDATTLPIPQRDGYYFTGWTGPGHTTPSRGVVIAKGTTGDVEYKANYEKIYKVSYSSAHGTPERSSDSIHKGGPKIKLPSVTADEGYTFNGWESLAWTGLKAAGQEVTFAGTEDVTVTASFTKIEYTITLNTDGGSVSDSGWTAAVANSRYTKSYNIESDDIVLPKPIRAGYTFMGWADSNGAAPQLSVTVSTGTTGSQKYTASWRFGAKGSMTIDPNGGSVHWDYYPDGYGLNVTPEESGTREGSFLCSYYQVSSWHTQSVSWVSDSDTVRQLLTEEGWDGAVRLWSNPVRQGYVFAGWKAVPENESAAVVKDVGALHYSLVGDVKVVAQWIPVHKVSLDRNASESEGEEIQSLYYKEGTAKLYMDAACTIEAESSDIVLPKFAGHTFLGYAATCTGGTIYISASLEPQNLTAALMTSDSTWYAQWRFGAKGSMTIDPNGGSVHWDYYPDGYGLNVTPEESGTREGSFLCSYYQVSSWHTQSVSWVSDSDTVRQLLTEEGWDGAVRLWSNPVRQGYVFAGWKAVPENESAAVMKSVSSLHYSLVGDVKVTAQWRPIVSADAPIEVTAQVDLLGIEDQVPASGYIESRSGGALKVAAVDFAPLDGATALFGTDAPKVFLEALAGEGATSADVRFSLGSRATEDDESRLAAFVLPDGFGTRIPIGYRFAISDEVLGAIDPATFEDKKTPVCSVVYTVALQSPPV